MLYYFTFFIVLSIHYFVLYTSAEHNNNVVDLELEKRREIARKYMDTLEKGKEHWVDPHDMIGHIDNFPKSKISPNQYDTASIKTKFNEPNKNIANNDISENKNKHKSGLLTNDKQSLCEINNIYTTRWLKKLISKFESNSLNENDVITISTDGSFLQALNILSTSENLKIAHIDEIVTNIIDKMIITKQNTFDWSDIEAYKSSSVFRYFIFISIGIGIYIIYHFAITRPISTLTIFIGVVSVIWHWIALYQKKVAEKHSHLSTHSYHECKNEDFSFFQQFYSYIKSYFITNNCVKYYEALMVDPLWEVSLSIAISDALTSVLVQPMYATSKAINSSIKLLFDDLSLFNTIILIFFIFLIFVMFCSYKVRLPFFLGSLEPADIRHNYVQDLKTNTTLTELKTTISKAVSSIQLSNASKNDTQTFVAGSESSETNFIPRQDINISPCSLKTSCTNCLRKMSNNFHICKDQQQICDSETHMQNLRKETENPGESKLSIESHGPKIDNKNICEREAHELFSKENEIGRNKDFSEMNLHSLIENINEDGMILNSSPCDENYETLKQNLEESENI